MVPEGFCHTAHQIQTPSNSGDIHTYIQASLFRPLTRISLQIRHWISKLLDWTQLYSVQVKVQVVLDFSELLSPSLRLIHPIVPPDNNSTPLAQKELCKRFPGFINFCSFIFSVCCKYLNTSASFLTVAALGQASGCLTLGSMWSFSI